jgi:hypothetical protein
MPIDKPWFEFAAAKPGEIPGTVGVYELADEAGDVIYIGFAGGRSLMGLRGVILAHVGDDEQNAVIRSRSRSFRYEITTNYLIRRLELLSRYAEDHGKLPAGNAASGESLPPLTRYHWKTANQDFS